MAIAMDGKILAAKVRAELKQKVDGHKAKTGRVPGLAVVLVGEDPASQVYVRMKNKACEEAGYKSIVNRMLAETTTEELLAVVNEYNNDDTINGILVQLPLPKQIDEHKVLYAIKPEKDVDGFHPFNVGLMNIGEETLYPCTPYGCMKFFEEYGIETSGKNAVVIGRSNIVGKPMASLLIKANCTVTICHSKTKDIAGICRQADIVVAAIGKPEFVTADFVKEGAVVIDVGINRVNDKLVGDVAYEEVAKKASYITPVPGGVGPMTIAMLLANTMKSFEATL
ncbi:bifunctional methylenetetrahydrofolate dehydrogenase/methenyltetrahydrofolate cyclohydrolase FolD [Seleniivibrio sp.]|uniref:bifunctional methylenetetrahydrofolate dehydrogenase/methenyltetrahydrofolate cyclohydrolase FolD n=1 Tax=Seleniivibrio sp. TaxID=2898801 RepID=UPI0025D0B088|nr:bifunctional methylenetetrahydrofolate dehydrogenase/methenyltetrahydrofolate cyclohydrolase FolD [Seleniivibrio sp.]MCD8553890.1 bifunctional methylenetetrahydrofolate dehydrogenase/methenyltetrahydrofolate cyclohydrolase FolD [Seleniivibrio sp.]